MSKRKSKEPPESASDKWQILGCLERKRASLEGCASEAHQGDRECLEQMLEAAEVELENAAMDETVRGWLIHSLSRMRSGEEPNAAFGWTAPTAHRPRSYWKRVRDADIARGVEYWMACGLSKGEAVEKLANEYNAFADEVGRVGIRRIEEIHSEHFPASSSSRKK